MLGALHIRRLYDDKKVALVHILISLDVKWITANCNLALCKNTVLTITKFELAAFSESLSDARLEYGSRVGVGV